MSVGSRADLTVSRNDPRPLFFPTSQVPEPRCDLELVLHPEFAAAEAIQSETHRSRELQLVLDPEFLQYQPADPTNAISSTDFVFDRFFSPSTQRNALRTRPNHAISSFFPTSVAKNSLCFRDKVCEKTAKNGGDSETRGHEVPTAKQTGRVRIRGTPQRGKQGTKHGTKSRKRNAQTAQIYSGRVDLRAKMVSWRTSGWLQSRRNWFKIPIRLKFPSS